MPIHAHFGEFWGHISTKWCHSSSLPQKDLLWAELRHLSHKPRKSVARFELSVGTGQEKSHKRLHFTYLGRSPTEAMYIKICLVGDVSDVITCTKFENEILRGYDFTGGGGSNFPFSYWFLNGPYNSAALQRCLWLCRAACKSLCKRWRSK